MGLTSRGLQAMFLLQAVRKGLFSHLFQLLEAAHTPWLVDPSCVFIVSKYELCPFHKALFFFNLLIYLESSQVAQW